MCGSRLVWVGEGVGGWLDGAVGVGGYTKNVGRFWTFFNAAELTCFRWDF